MKTSKNSKTKNKSKTKKRKTNNSAMILRYTGTPGISKEDAHTDLVKICSHEALHAAIFIYSRIGQGINKDDVNELLAYLVGYITECMYKTVTK